MRYIFLILFCLLVSCDGGEVSFEVIDNKDECHSCPGSLVVKKNNMVDTIKTGSWGKTSDNYSVVKILNNDYVVLKTSRFGMGILEEGIYIYSTENNSFLKKVFEKLYITQADSYNEVQGGALKCTRIKRNLKFDFESNFLKVNIDTTLSFLIEPDEEFTLISSGTKQEKHIIFE